MSSWFHRRSTCRLCGSTDFDAAVALRPIPIITPNVDARSATTQHDGIQGISVPLALYRCTGCGHVQLLDVVDPKVQYNNFRYTTTISLGLPEHFRKFAREVTEASGAKVDAFVLEIGSNDGTLLRAFKECGARVLGVDPANEIAGRATASGVKTLATFFTEQLAREIRAEHGAADIVIANNTFANIDDLADFAAGVRTALAPNGVFVFETSYGADVVDKTLIDTVYHEHLSYFMARPLERYFARHGMQLIDIQQIWTKGGSIRGMVQLAGGRRPRNPSVDAAIADEKRRGFEGTQPFKRMNTAVSAVTEEVKKLVTARVRAGKKVAGYGASVGTVTLIEQFGLGPDLDFVADDNALCDVVASSSYLVPVLKSEAIYERKPQSIVLLAWRYAEPIFKRHQKYLDAGGDFIIPLPQVSVHARKAHAPSGGVAN